MKADGKMINGFVPGVVDLPSQTQAMISARNQYLGPAYRLFYQKPLHVVRGEDCFLYTADGKRYLDAYNNVASIGHCHPHVVNAIARQASLLSTNTRYLSQAILDYAERLLASFPSPLSHIMFACTGSEANDLAIRLAKHYTGNQGFIVTDNAYHGVTDRVARLSPSLGPAVGLDETIRTIPAPLDGDGQALAQRLEFAIADLAKHGIRPAGFICDTIFSSDGVAAHPQGFLQPAVEAIHKAGGLFIADEVQAGFGRTGSGLWGFARHAIIPDLVSLGKPMGNGYPVAGLVMAPEIVASFGAQARYFNTFGGNSVAIAAASAVLDVIEQQDLINNARIIGESLWQGLTELFPQTQIRAVGLYIGIDILDVNAKPNPIKAQHIVNALAEQGVLISATGPLGHILKIRPPLTFGPQHVELFLKSLQQVLA